MKLRAHGKTDIGKQREHNEDAFLVNEEMGLFAVADGLGGHSAGEVASGLALEVVQQELDTWSGILAEYKSGGSIEVRDVILNLIEESVQRSCQRIFGEAAVDEVRRGMGTTLSLLLIRDTGAFLGHVGDSRVYLIREGTVHQITEDHSLVNEMRRRGFLSEKAARNASFKNVITRAVGHNEWVQVDTLHVDLIGGDLLLLCSDGLHGYLRPGDVEDVLAAGPLEDAPDRFVQLANERGGADNITVVLVEVPEEEAGSTGELRRAMETMRESALLKYLTYRELITLWNVSYIRSVAEGETIARTGEAVSEMLLLIQGQAAVRKDDHEVARLDPGSHFGVTAMFTSTTSPYDVRMREPGKLLVIGREQFHSLVHRETSLGVKFLWRLVQTMAAQRTRSEEDELLSHFQEDMTPDWMLQKD